MIVYTSVCYNYIPKAKVLADSLKKFNPEATFVVGLTERPTDTPPVDLSGFDHVLFSADIGIENFESFIFKHSIVEASTSVKGHLLLELMNRFPDEQNFIYLDPDIQVFGPLVELTDSLEKHNIILTPHLCAPETELFAVMDNEICALKHGVFNLGFLAVRRSKEATEFVQWWADRLLEFCYADIPGGLFTDQRWMDLAPCFFDIFVLKHVGYNMAPWNLSKRKLSYGENGELIVNGLPLRFFHFSGFDSGANEMVAKKYCPDPEDPIYKLREDYIFLQEEAGQSKIGNTPWGYNCYSNGVKIKNLHREYYRFTPEIRKEYPFPFDANGTSSYYSHVSSLSKKKLNRAHTDQESFAQLWEYTKEDFKTGGVSLVAQKAIKKLLRQIGK